MHTAGARDVPGHGFMAFIVLMAGMNAVHARGNGPNFERERQCGKRAGWAAVRS
jgi:hypothetical protein